MIPDELRSHAGLETGSEVVVIGAITHAEIWNVERFSGDRALALVQQARKREREDEEEESP
jgi:DNA-binding transcriptional regulator/RsmH inhibitor MraZ